MAFLNPQSLRLHDYLFDWENPLLQPKVHLNLRNVFHLKGKTAVSCNSRNLCSSLHFLENPSEESVLKRGFLKTKSRGNFSSVYTKILKCTDDGMFEDAIRAYLSALENGFPVEDFHWFPCLIKAFGGLFDVEKGRQIHAHVLKFGALGDVYVANALLTMYFKCGVVEDAVKLFESMLEKDSVSWNAIISGFFKSGDYAGSLRIFRGMIKEYGYPNRVACLSALSACASINSLVHGKEVHGFLVKSGLNFDDFLVSGLIEMYLKCTELTSAEHVFRSILNLESVRGNAVVWTVMIAGYVSEDSMSSALDLFIGMLEMGVKPDSSTMVAVLVMCSKLLDLEIGKQIHSLILKLGLDDNERVETALIEMYFKCSDPKAGIKIFTMSQNRNFIMWGVIISNCVQNGYPDESLQFFHNFMFKHGCPDAIMLLAVLRACSSLALKPKGNEIHGLVIKTGHSTDMFIGGALVDLYGKCKDMESAQKIFSRLPSRDLVSWNALISGFCQNKLADEALRAFRDMLSDDIKPNTVTSSLILSICASLSSRILCQELHCFLIRQGFEANSLVNNSLISAYAKCGDIDLSWTVFEKMPERNDVTWNSIILAFGMHGNVEKMFASFENMKQAGLKPDHATFTALLSGCSHAGKVDTGWQLFESMVEEYKLQPQLEHYTCMVDLIGRAGHLNEAYNLVLSMPCTPDDRTWGSLLGSCRSHGDEKLAEIVASHIFKVNPTSIGYRVLLANLYEDFGRLNQVNKVRGEIKDLQLKKQPGCSWIEINNSIHIFVAGDNTHHQSQEMYAALKALNLEMEWLGYIPKMSLVV